MKILTFKRLIGLGALGSFAYIHKQRGGEWTIASITDTLQHLWSSAVNKLKDESRLARSRVAGSTEPAARDSPSGDQGPRSYGNNIRRTDNPGRQ